MKWLVSLNELVGLYEMGELQQVHTSQIAWPSK